MTALHEGQKRRVAATLGVLEALHGQMKALEAEGVEGLDMVCCQLEDTYATLEPVLTGGNHAEALARNAV